MCHTTDSIYLPKYKPADARSAWGRGVREYAQELSERFRENYGADTKITEQRLLNGARNWHEYSWGGCAMIYDRDICERLATPSEQKRTRCGELPPNSSEQWLDVQARALLQACALILKEGLL